MSEAGTENFEDVKKRLDEIVEAVSDENLPLDDALKLYEEAVQLGLRASSLLEENLEERNARFDEEQSEGGHVERDGSLETEQHASEKNGLSSGDDQTSEAASHSSHAMQTASLAASNLDGESVRAVEGN